MACSSFPWLQDFEFLEFFAGLGNLTKAMKSASYKCGRFDLLDNSNPGRHKTNYMDLNSESGFMFPGLIWVYLNVFDHTSAPYIVGDSVLNNQSIPARLKFHGAITEACSSILVEVCSGRLCCALWDKVLQLLQGKCRDVISKCLHSYWNGSLQVRSIFKQAAGEDRGLTWILLFCAKWCIMYNCSSVRMFTGLKIETTTNILQYGHI